MLSCVFADQILYVWNIVLNVLCCNYLQKYKFVFSKLPISSLHFFSENQKTSKLMQSNFFYILLYKIHILAQ